jgi:hypothetical protein
MRFLNFEVYITETALTNAGKEHQAEKGSTAHGTQAVDTQLLGCHNAISGTPAML